MSFGRRAAALLLMVLPSVVGAQAASAPSGRCKLQLTSDRALNSTKLPSGQFNIITAGNVVIRCPAQNLVLRSDSLESYGDEGRIVFIGHADYTEPRLKLKADVITYYQRDERVLAVQNVVATLPSGSTLRGPQVEFFRAVPRVRPQQSATATGRPTVSLVERDAQGKPQPPVQVTGANIYLLGDSLVSAVGNVVVVRPELTATGDSLYANSGSGLLRLMREPKITGTKGRPFTLTGTAIDLLSRKRKLERVVAKDSAVATSEDLVLRADTLDLRIVDDLLQRAIAWGKSRARAASSSQTMVADSIDVLLPAQRVRTLYAIRAASAEGAPDTTKFRTTEKDRLTGDTIIAHFDTVASRDTSSKPRIRQLVAIASKTVLATSLQHLPPRDTTLCKPAINYFRGSLITVTFDSAKVSTVDVKDRAGGLYIDPQPDSTSRCRALVAGKAPPDTGGVTTAPARGSAPSPTPSPSSPPPATTPAVPPVTPKRP
jgi:hypothetical protein